MRSWRYICLSFFLLYSCTKEVIKPDTPSSGEMIQVGTADDSKYLEQNIWTYSQMKSWYFWTDEIPDSTDLDFSADPFDFFESLLSDSDQFSYLDINPDYKKSEVLYDGIDYQPYKDVSGRTVYRVIKVNDPSLRSQWARGDWFVMCGNMPVKGMISQGRFIEDRTTTRPSRYYPDSFVDTLYHVNGKRIGYILFEDFSLYVTFAKAVHSLRSKGGVDELIIDLRYNPGGYVDVCRKISSLIVPPQYLGGLFQIQEFNEEQNLKKIQKQGGGDGLDSLYFLNDVRTEEINLGLDRLYVLMTRHTASASEALIHCLRPYMEVVTIGLVSRGKNVGGQSISNERFRYALHPITFQYMDAEGELFSSDGMEPDIYAEDDLDHELGDMDEGMLSAAIAHISGETNVPEESMNKRIGKVFPVECGKSSIEIKNNL